MSALLSSATVADNLGCREESKPRASTSAIEISGLDHMTEESRVAIVERSITDPVVKPEGDR